MRRKRPLSSLFLRLVFLTFVCLPTTAFAQTETFGSNDDPREQLQRVWWKREKTFDVGGGLSLIGAHWRGAASVGFNAVTRPFTARLGGTLRAGVYGSYKPDIDEPYDALRLIESIRYNAPANRPFYLRVGPIDRMQLGTGHLVNFYNSQVAYEERTVGIESFKQYRYGSIGVFTDNVLLNGVTGGRMTVLPFFWADDARTRSFRVGLNYVTDLGHAGEGSTGRFEGYNMDMSFDVVPSGAINLSPFASIAWYPDYGSGMGFGADLESLNFLDFARFRVRSGLFYNGRGFMPGYVGSLYEVHNTASRILSSEGGVSFPDRMAGVRLDQAGGGNDLLTEIRLVIFEQFEFWYSYRKHYGTQPLSEQHIRLFLQSNDRFRVDVGIDRQGLRSFWSLFNDVNDQSALIFDTQYNLGGPFWTWLRARYTYERVADAADGTPRYLVQRRFEPLVGLRLSF